MVHRIFIDEPEIIPDLEHLQKRGNDGIFRCAHQVGILLSEDRRRLLQPVVRDPDEEVVDLVRPNIVHQVMRPAIVAIEGAEGAAHKVPFLVRVPWHVLIVVVEECCDDEPGGKDEEGRCVMRHEF